MFNTTYTQMTVKEVFDKLAESKGKENDEKMVALLTALLPFIPRSSEKKLNDFTSSWNFNQPYEYYQSEVMNLTRSLVEENIGKPVSFFGRLLGKRVLQWDSIVKVQEC